MSETTRVFVTGTGVVSPLGNSTGCFWEHLIAGKSGAGPITRFDVSAYTTRFACEVKDFSFEGIIDRKDAKRMDRFVQYAVVAAHEALKNSGLDLESVDRKRIGVIIGSGIGGMETFEEQHSNLVQKGPGRVSPFFIPMMIVDMAAGQISIQFGLQGPNFATVSAISARRAASNVASAAPPGTFPSFSSSADLPTAKTRTDRTGAEDLMKSIKRPPSGTLSTSTITNSHLDRLLASNADTTSGAAENVCTLSAFKAVFTASINDAFVLSTWVDTDGLL